MATGKRVEELGLLLKTMPGSYKVWYEYLRLRLESTRLLPINHPEFESVYNSFEQALGTMHKMPRIWLLYLETLISHKFITRTRRTFDRALSALPVTQHHRIWDLYLPFVSQNYIPIETSIRVFRRYIMFDPSHTVVFFDFLVSSERWQEASLLLSSLLSNNGEDDLLSVVNSYKPKHVLWTDLFHLLSNHATEVQGLDVDSIIRAAIRNFTDDVGRLWIYLADFYIKKGLHGMASDIFEEAMVTVNTLRDFSLIFDAYTQFQESLLVLKLDNIECVENEGEDLGDDNKDFRWNCKLSVSDFQKKLLKGFWLSDHNDLDLRLSRMEDLLDRRPLLTNSVLLRQNPHNVQNWHHRATLFQGHPRRQILTYAEAVRTVDPTKALGKPHTLWLALAKLYEAHNDLPNARLVFKEAVEADYKSVDHLATLWCEWAEMELRHKNFNGALDLLRSATSVPSLEVKRRLPAGAPEPVQMKVHKSLKLWAFYVDLEESIGNVETTRSIYATILDLRIATPQIVLNYATFLEEHKYYDDAFRVYQRGVKRFKYPHVKDIWVTYLSKYVQRYKDSKLEQARDLFDNAIQTAPAECVKQLFLQYAKLEETYGSAKQAMNIYAKATTAVPADEKLSMYEIYIARAREMFGVPLTREIYEKAISSGLPEKDLKAVCLKYAEFEKSLGEIERSRALYTHASQFADPRTDADFWSKWYEFEVQHGSEDTFREMLLVRRTVAASFCQTIVPDHLNQTNEKAKAAADGEAAVIPPLDADFTVKDKSMTVGGFVSAGYEGPSDVGRKSVNLEEIELPDKSDSEDEEQIETSPKGVRSAPCLAKKRKAETCLGGHERIRRRFTLQNIGVEQFQ